MASPTTDEAGAGNSNEQHLPFCGPSDFWKQVDACTEETVLVFSPVSRAQYETVIRTRERRVDFWDSDENELWVTACTSRSHEFLHKHLGHAVLAKTWRMRLPDELELEPTGSTTYPVRGAEGNSGDADSSFEAPSQRPSMVSWPTLVIEAGCAQSMANLRKKARWWFEGSNYQVQIVLIAKLFAASRKVVIEKYTAKQVQAYIDAARTRGEMTQPPEAQPLPTPDHVVTIQPPPNVIIGELTDRSSIIVDGDSLVLEFSLLFLREAGEEDHGRGFPATGNHGFLGLIGSWRWWRWWLRRICPVHVSRE